MQIDNKRVVSINFAVKATRGKLEVEILANYTFSSKHWDVMYGDKAELVGAMFGDCVEKDIEKTVVESIKEAGFRALAMIELERG